MWGKSKLSACSFGQLRRSGAVQRNSNNKAPDLGTLLQHFCHCGTFFSAIATSLGTGRHLFVIWHLLASGRTIVAAFRTTFARVYAQSALPSAK